MRSESSSIEMSVPAKRPGASWKRPTSIGSAFSPDRPFVFVTRTRDPSVSVCALTSPETVRASGAGGGGPSFGLLIGPDMAPTVEANTILSGDAGDGGDGDGGEGGDGGYSYAVFDFDPNDGMVPVLIGNDLDYGNPGAGGDGGGVQGNANTRNF